MTITHWKLASAQSVGRGHLKQQLPCQDYTLSVQTPEMTIIVLADGAGSASSSHIGAKAVVHKMANILQNHFQDMFNEEDQQLLRRRIIGMLLHELESTEDFSGNVKDYASTLQYVAIKGDRYVAGHIGDGVIGMQVTGGNFKVLSNPENGLFANTTYFITSDEAWKYLRLYKGTAEGKTGFILMSDGTAESLFNKQAQGFAPAISRMLDWLRNHPNKKITEVLENNLDTVIKQQTQDDCSIALASLATWEAEELLNTAPEYQADFMGVHSKLIVDGIETFDEFYQEKSTLSEQLQQIEDEYEETQYVDDNGEDENIHVDNTYEELEEIDSTDNLDEKDDEILELDPYSDAHDVESVSITEDLDDLNSMKDLEIEVENHEMEIAEEVEK